MDSNNVLTITSNMDELDKDFSSWLKLSDIARKVSDDKCKEAYGCTNRVLYNNLKKKIMLNKEFDKNIMIQSDNVITNESFDYSNIDRKDLIMKISLVKSMNNNDIVTAILYPYDPELINNDNYKESYKKEFLEIYNKFVGLTDKYQKYSNMLSIQIFGYNVWNMYRFIAPDILEDTTSDTLVLSRDFINSYTSAVEESLTEDFVDKNVINLYKFKICSCMSSISEASTNDVFARTLISEVNHYIYTDNFENHVNSVVPYFTLDEYCSISDKEYPDIDFNNSRDYYNKIVKLYEDFKDSDYSDSIVESKLVDLAWNPYVDPKKYMSKARDRQVRWFNEHCCHIIDISNIDNISSLTESTKSMRKMYSKLDVYPVYIILTYTGTAFSKIIRKIKKSTFTHAGITLDSDLSNILTFMYYDKNNKGFYSESLEKYLKINPETSIDVLCLFVDKDTKAKLEDAIAYFTSNKSKTSYNFKNLINILRNKAKDNDPENLSMVCSQFVDTILKLANINVTNKSSNLVIPQDFEDIKHPRIFKLYEGFGKWYDEARVEGKIYDLIYNTNAEDIRYNDFIEQVSESIANFIYHRYNIIDNPEANKLLQEFYNYISIETI